MDRIKRLAAIIAELEPNQFMDEQGFKIRRSKTNHLSITRRRNGEFLILGHHINNFEAAKLLIENGFEEEESTREKYEKELDEVTIKIREIVASKFGKNKDLIEKLIELAQFEREIQEEE